MTDDPAREPLLPSLRDPAVDAALRQSLRVLRDHAEDPHVRRAVDDVLAGRSSLRALARDRAFGDLVAPLADEGWQRWEAMPDDERRALTEEARRKVES